MTIQKLYEASLNHKNSRIASLHYKLNKGLANIAYPVLGKCKTGVDEKSDIIISLASYPDRIDTVHLTIMTLLSQNVRPRAVMLCLAKEQFPNGEKDLPDFSPDGQIRQGQALLAIVFFTDGIKHGGGCFETLRGNTSRPFFHDGLAESVFIHLTVFPGTAIGSVLGGPDAGLFVSA